MTTAVRKNRRHTGVDRVANHDGRVPDFHARDICDRVIRAWLEDSGRDTELSCASALLGGQRRREQHGHGS